MTKQSKPKRELDGRALSFGVFIVSLTLLVGLEIQRSPDVTVAAVAQASAVEHPAPAPSTVREVHVRNGDPVEAGDLLVTLDDEELRRTLRYLDIDIAVAIEEGRLAQAQVADESSRQALDARAQLRAAIRDAEIVRGEVASHEALVVTAQEAAARAQSLSEQRLLQNAAADDARRRLAEIEASREAAEARLNAELRRLRQTQQTTAIGSSEELLTATVRLHQSRLESLQLRRRDTAEQIARLQVHAAAPGVVANVPDMGRAVALGESVARVVPRQATEVVAYLSPDTNPDSVVTGRRVLIAQADGDACAGELVRGAGAEVVTMPGQAIGTSRIAPTGLPVHVALPPECSLGVGQLVWVTLETR